MTARFISLSVPQAEWKSYVIIIWVEPNFVAFQLGRSWPHPTNWSQASSGWQEPACNSLCKSCLFIYLLVSLLLTAEVKTGISKMLHLVFQKNKQKTTKAPTRLLWSHPFLWVGLMSDLHTDSSEPHFHVKRIDKLWLASASYQQSFKQKTWQDHDCMNVATKVSTSEALM